MSATFSSYGIAAALEEIQRRNQPSGTSFVFERGTVGPALSFEDAERRLADAMKPARLTPLPETPEAL
jgi:hypothetical protein